MKKQYMMTVILMAIANPVVLALISYRIKVKGSEILQSLVNGHNRAFGQDNLLKSSPDLTVWNPAISQMKSFVTTIINENKGFFGFKSSTLTNALDKVTKAEIDLVNAIKISRGLIGSRAGLTQQIEIFTKIINDMITVQKTLTMKDASIAKNEAQKILKNSALFIETTASKARKDASAALK